MSSCDKMEIKWHIVNIMWRVLHFAHPHLIRLDIAVRCCWMKLSSDLMTEGKWSPSILSRNGNRWTNIELKIIWQTSLCATEWRVRIINDTFPPLTPHSQSIWTESTHTRGKSYCQWVSPLLIFIFLFALRYEFLTLMVFYWSADQSPAYSVTLPLRNPICDIDLINLLCTGGGWILFWKVKEL